MKPDSEEFVSALEEALTRVSSLDTASFDRARAARSHTGDRIDRILVRLGLVSEDKIVTALSACCGIPVVACLPKEPQHLDEVPIQFLKNNKILPLFATEKHTDVGIVDPFNKRALDALSYFLGHDVRPHLMAESDFERTFASLYEIASPLGALADTTFDDELGADDVSRLRDVANEAPVIQLVNQLIAAGVERGASDIHIEPLVDALRVRFRVDGSMTVANVLPVHMRAPIASRLKVMSQLNIAERRLPQDGRLKVAVRGREIDFRISTAPTLFGESIVLRILDRSRVALSLESLGFAERHIKQFQTLLGRPNGVLLVTGPTGSGKTTTLYAALQHLNDTQRKIYTVEDPVEYQLAGVNQVQVNPKIGLGFSSALRSILRQDPDVLMIGEIRDAETAHIAVQAALTGHLVLSTVHTNSAAATVTRLLDMGIQGYLLAATIVGVSAQRLVRRLCTYCAAPSAASTTKFKEMRGASSAPMEDNAVREARGCELCHQVGFSGRTTIMELMPVSDEIRGLITRGASEKEIEKVAIAQGMQTLLRDGLERVGEGRTTLDEILYVTHAE